MDDQGLDRQGKGLDRRTFIKRTGMAAGGVALLGSLPAALRSPPAVAQAAGGALSAGEMKTLEALLSQLMPKDALGPGAVELGVPEYISSSLTTSYAPLLSTYKSFLATLDKAAGSAGADSFEDLSGGAQVKLLEGLEEGKAAGLSSAEKAEVEATFPLVLEHMREGMFGDPMYGGNKGLAGWELIGYPGIQLAATEPVQQVGAKVPPTGMTAENYGGEPYDGTPV
ncbi:MAG TPA: gluconate 2-dehydrogenase subunit 3 family protein [Solirubrobacterales bacterium]|jgi:gluconate 2-dehydrogenase gamma chain|nr:gluconate 2-dehydrogenase subunit 3 family protein [Solirubrobacterales bacterium]